MTATAVAVAVAAVLAIAVPAAAFWTPGISLRFSRVRSPLLACERHAEDDEWSVTTVEKLRELIPAGPGGSGLADAQKVINTIDDQMCGFIQRSPFLHIATCDKNGMPFCSPKGDDPGFVKVLDQTTLLIPDRPGNKLLFGMQNLIENPQIGLCFGIPGNDATLRIGGVASLTKNPALLELLSARERPATLAIRVKVDHAFFHCSKAFMRAKLWKPDSWPEETYQVARHCSIVHS